MNSPTKHYLLLSGTRSTGPNFRELWEYRELVGFLAWREVSSRYRQAALGAAWAVIQPVMTMLIFNVIFGRLAKVPSDGMPYPIFSFAALLPWQYFQTATQAATNSLITNTALITKVYFPRLVIPVSAVLPALIDLGIAFLIFVVLMLHYGVSPSWRILWLPMFLLLAFCMTLGLGLWLSALSVEYRDVRHVIPFIMQLWLFASPVTYSSSLIPEQWRFIYGLNPMVEVITGFRWCTLGVGYPFSIEALTSVLSSVVLLVSGLFYFNKMERKFADVI